VTYYHPLGTELRHALYLGHHFQLEERDGERKYGNDGVLSRKVVRLPFMIRKISRNKALLPLTRFPHVLIGLMTLFTL